MNATETINSLETQLNSALRDAEAFLSEVAEDGFNYHRELSDDIAARAEEISKRFDAALVRIATLVRHSPMMGQVDLQALQIATRRINAALRFRKFEEWVPSVIYDVDVVLGIRPGGFSEDRKTSSHEALSIIRDALESVMRRLGILRAQAEAEDLGEAVQAWLTQAGTSPAGRPKPQGAFIMMMMDSGKPELEDVKQVIQEEFARFGIKAVRADDIQHSGEITHRILEEINNSEFLIADLTGERPSVYYEVGYAHAIGKHPILFCRAGTVRHFDLKLYNCPEYSNMTELRKMLRRRLAAILGRDNDSEASPAN